MSEQKQPGGSPPVELARRMMAYSDALHCGDNIGVRRDDLQAALDGDPEAMARLRERLDH